MTGVGLQPGSLTTRSAKRRRLRHDFSPWVSFIVTSPRGESLLNPIKNRFGRARGCRSTQKIRNFTVL